MGSKNSSRIVSVGSATAGPGEVARGTIPTLRRVDGSTYDIPVTVINGSSEGPVLWLDGAIHGDEPAGSRAIGKLTQWVTPKMLAGALVAVPVLNVSAFEAHQRGSPLDGKDLNRISPGKPTGSFSDRLAAMLNTLIGDLANYYVGLHGSGTTAWCVPYSVYAVAGSVGATCEEMAKATGIRLGYRGTGDLTGALYYQLMSRGIPSILIEAGGEGKVKDEDVKALFEAVVNVMRYLKMLNGSVPQLSEYLIMTGATTVTATHGGFLELAFSPGDRVVKDQVLARVFDVYGDEVETLRCPAEQGMLFAAPTRGLVDPGERVCSVLTWEA